MPEVTVAVKPTPTLAFAARHLLAPETLGPFSARASAALRLQVAVDIVPLQPFVDPFADRGADAQTR